MLGFGGSCAGQARRLCWQLFLLAGLLLPRLLVVGAASAGRSAAAAAAAAAATKDTEGPNPVAGESEKLLAWKATAYEGLLQQRLEWCHRCLRLRLRLVKGWPFILPGQVKPTGPPPTIEGEVSSCSEGVRKTLFHRLKDRKKMLPYDRRLDGMDRWQISQWLTARQAEVLLHFVCLEDDFSLMHSPAAPPLRDDNGRRRSSDAEPSVVEGAADAASAARLALPASRPEAKSTDKEAHHARRFVSSGSRLDDARQEGGHGSGFVAEAKPLRSWAQRVMDDIRESGWPGLRTRTAEWGMKKLQQGSPPANGGRGGVIRPNFVGLKVHRR